MNSLQWKLLCRFMWLVVTYLLEPESENIEQVRTALEVEIDSEEWGK